MDNSLKIEIEWYIRYCKEQESIDVNPLAAMLAISAFERSPNDSEHEWRAKNAIIFDAMLKLHNSGYALERLKKTLR